MASPYFNGPKPSGKAASLVANEKPPKVAPPKPAGKVPLPPSLNPKADTRFVKVRAHVRQIPVKPTPKPVLSGPRLEAAKAPTARVSYKPFYKGQKPDHYEPKAGPLGVGMDATPGGIAGRVQYGKPVYKLPKAGPSGQRGLVGKGGVVVTAAQAQKQLGTTPTIAMQALNQAVHPVTDLSQQVLGTKPFKAKGVVSDVANIASNLVSPEKAGAAAGIFGGLRGLKAAKGAETAAEAAKAAAPQVKEEAAVVQGALKGARGIRGKQEAGYSAERAKRAAAANVHLTNTALPPDERLRLAKNELKGELPKIDFQGMKVLDDQALTKLQTHILDHPHLMPFQKITASTALANAMAGKVPTRSELTLLEHVFGKATANSLGAVAKHPLKDTILSVLNVPRSLMASFDLSAPFRQGLVVSTRHPKIFAQNFGPMVKAFGSEKVYNAALDEIKARPTYPLMMEGKLSLTDLNQHVGDREEQFASNIAEKIPGVGHGVRASGRAYTGFLDKTRADVFDHLIQRAQSQGINVQDPKFLKSLGSYINSATGRGDLGHFQEAGKVLNTFFFSPRLLASRLNFLNPTYYARLDPFARKEALRSAIQLAGTLSTLIALASQVPGVKTIVDPRNPDWGKIRLGNTRIDIAGGFQQPLRLLAQLSTGVAISSTTGKKLSLGASGFGQANRLDLFLRFFEGKESPLASFATDWLRNSNQVGQKFSLGKEAASRMIPLLAQDSYDLYNAKHGGVNGIAAAFAGYGIGSVGLGLQTYGSKPPGGKAKKPPEYFGAGPSGGSSPYFSSPASSGGGGYFATP